jgi:hypothetical protein
LKKISRFTISDEEQRPVYEAVVIYPIIGNVDYPKRITLYSDSLIQIISSIENKGIGTLNAKLQLTNKNIQSEPLHLFINPLSFKDGEIECKYSGEEFEENKVEVTATLLIMNVDYPENLIEFPVVLTILKSRINQSSERISMPLWFVILASFISCTLLFFTLWTFYKYRAIKVIQKKRTPTPKPAISDLKAVFEEVHNQFLLYVFNYFIENKEWPSKEYFAGIAEKNASFAKNALGQTEAIVNMMQQTKVMLNEKGEAFDEDLYPQYVTRAISLCLVIKQTSYKYIFSDNDDTSHKNIHDTLQNSNLLNKLFEKYPIYNQNNIIKEIDTLICDNSVLKNKLNIAYDEIKFLEIEISALEVTIENLNLEIHRLNTLLKSPNQLQMFKWYLNRLAEVIKDIRNLNWGRYSELKQLFLRQLKGNNEDKLNLYLRSINELDVLPESITDQGLDNFSYLFTEIYRLQSFSKFSLFKSVFKEIGFPFNKYEGILKSLEGFFLNTWELRLIVPEIYSDIFSYDKHIEVDGVSHIISSQIISVNKYEEGITSGTIRDYQYIGFVSEKLGVNRKPKVYIKR